MTILAIDHVQLAMPKGEEARARAFYCKVLGMTEVAKPPGLVGRGGAWFSAANVHIHLGVEDDFRPAKKAHVALRVKDEAALRSALNAAGYPCREDVDIGEISRFFSEDCFGNRIEFIQQL